MYTTEWKRGLKKKNNLIISVSYLKKQENKIQALTTFEVFVINFELQPRF